MVARGLDRAVAVGTSAHSGHAKHLVHTLLKMAKGEAKDYNIKDPDTLPERIGTSGIEGEDTRG